MCHHGDTCWCSSAPESMAASAPHCLLSAVCLCVCRMQASAFVLFPDMQSACDSVKHLKASGVASAVEVCDYNSLR